MQTGIKSKSVLLLAGLVGCSASEPPPTPAAPAIAGDAVEPRVFFVDAAGLVGLDFVHTNGASQDRYFPETMAGGGAFVDFDGDGYLDVYAVNGAWIADPPPGPTAVNALFRNDGRGGFAAVENAGGADHGGFGMGCAAGDMDNDGDADLYVTNFGPNVLFRNDGPGRFVDWTGPSGLADERWGTSSALGDYDLDGDLDLYLANYVVYDPADKDAAVVPYMAGHESYNGQVPGYPHPSNFPGSPDVLYRNEGDNRFTDVTRQAGVYDEEGKGLGVVFGDYDNDGWPDIYVANDGVRNFLYRNGGQGVFVERGSMAGVGYGQDGKRQAGMGTDWGDYDNDGWLDLVVTNFQRETNNIYRNQRGTFFSEVSFAAGIGLSSLPLLGFGVNFFDYDNDGWQDLFIANGHVLDNVAAMDQSTEYAQANLLYHNEGPAQDGRIVFRHASAGAGLQLVQVSRGSAVGDYDNDGDVDLLVVNLGQALALLRNEGGNKGHWLTVDTVGGPSNRDGIGARLTLLAGGAKQVKEVRGSRSYLSQGDLRVHFGLGRASRVDTLMVRWPSGRVEQLAGVPANQFVVVREGAGLVGREARQRQ